MIGNVCTDFEITLNLMPHRIQVNVAGSDWAVHFIGPDGQTRVGPWLLHESHNEVLKILEWCDITPQALEDHHSAIRRWNFNSAVVWLTDAKLAALIKRGEGWPWNGYELQKMKRAGKYPPERLTTANVRKATGCSDPR